MGAYTDLGGGKQLWVPSNPYTTVEQVMIDLRKPSSEAPEGSVTRNEVLIAIEHASRFVDRWMGRDFFQHDHTIAPLEFDEMDENVWRNECHLPYSPLISGLVVKVGGVTKTNGTDYVLKEKAYADTSLKCVLIALASFYTGSQTGAWGLSRAGGAVLQVYGLFGYAQATEDAVPTGIPEVIEMATHSIAAVLSGHMRKEIVTLDGRRDEVVTKELEKIAVEILGEKYGTVLC